MVDLWVEIATLSVLIGLSGFFSGLEVALVGVRKSKVVQLFNEGKKGSKALHKLKMNPSWMMSSVNLGNNLSKRRSVSTCNKSCYPIIWR